MTKSCRYCALDILQTFGERNQARKYKQDTQTIQTLLYSDVQVENITRICIIILYNRKVKETDKPSSFATIKLKL